MSIVKYKNLEAYDLTKYGFSLESKRIKTFIDKFNDKKTFVIRRNNAIGREENIILAKNDRNKKSIQLFEDIILSSKTSRQKNTEINKLVFYSENGIAIKFKDFVKTHEFGGELIGEFESKEIKFINDQIQKIKKLTNEPLVKIRVNNKIYFIDYAKKSKQGVKSDIEFVDMTGKSVVWVSSKAGSTAQGFQQWSGITSRAGITISSSYETNNFVESVREKYPEGIPDNMFVQRKINHISIKRAATYGPEYKLSRNNENNVNLIIQGNIRLTKIDKEFYELRGYKSFKNPRIPSDEYEPYFMGRASNDRNNFGIPNTRLGIFPKNTAGNRKVENI